MMVHFFSSSCSASLIFLVDTTIASVKLQLAREDALHTSTSEAQTDISPTSFVVTGLELESQRHKLLAAITSHKSNTTAAKLADLQNKLNSLSHRISQWRKVQLLHMPGVPLLCSTEADLPDEIEGPSPVLNLTSLKVKLLLPSDLDPSICSKCCPQSLLQTEIRLRFATAEDALQDIQKYLAVKKTLVNYKIKHVSGPGQRANTRARAIIDRFKSKIEHCADKYKAASNALELLDRDGSQTSSLFNVNWTHRFMPLTTKDLVFLNDDPEEEEEEGLSRVSRTDTRKRKRHEEQLGEGHRTLGWIWRMPSWNPGQDSNTQDNDPFNTTVRIEWAKTKARAERWQEEVILLQEEMRRAIVDMEWQAQQWKTRVNARSDVSPDLLQGLMAYTYKQANIHTSFAASYAKKWIPILKQNGFDYSFASHYETADIQDPKGKKKAASVQNIQDELESEWESEDEHLE